MIRKGFLITLALFMVFSLAACADEVPEVVDEVEEALTWDEILEAAQQEGKVVVYSSGDPRFEEPAMDLFEELTGIKVEYSRPGGGEVVIRQIETERRAGQNLVDVVTLTDRTLAMYALNEGWARIVDGDLLPNIDNYLPEFQFDEYFYFPAYTLPMPILYNTDLVSEDELPQTYEGLADPRWKGNISFGQPENAGTMVVTIFALVEMYGWDFIEKLKENDLSETRLSGESALRIAQGEMEIGIIPSIWALQQVYQEFPAALYFPDNLIVAQGNSLVLSDSPNPNAALVLQNFMLSPEWVAGYDLPPVGIWFPFKGEYKADAHLPDDPVLLDIDLNKLYDSRLEIIAKWREIMK